MSTNDLQIHELQDHEAEPNHSEIPTEATNEWHEEVSSKVMDD
ncbi:MAG: hypothetical protein AAFO96_13570 [Bacteroidota bacterium]